jgi:hydroxymethylglutaryl-CoA lyase
MSEQIATIVEVGPRDGFQSITEKIPTQSKIALIESLHAAGVRRMEATAFVSPKAVPQLSDATDILAAAQALPGLDVQVLVPNMRNAERALAVGSRHIAFVVSVSPRHNISNVRRTPQASVAEYSNIVAALRPNTKIRLNLATAFDCPFAGAVPVKATLDLLGMLVPLAPDAEICLCDTTGRVTPDRIRSLFDCARGRFPQVAHWAYHGHDTYGLGVANALAAWEAGVPVIDASFAGLGGCPFAPGATGNVATEDIVWTFEQMGIHCGIDLDQLMAAARQGAALPSASHGGRVRVALDARLRHGSATAQGFASHD